MTTSSTSPDPAAPVANMTLQTDEAKAIAADIVTENAALEQAAESAEAEAEVVAAQASQLAEVTEEVLEELQEQAEHAGPAATAR